MHKRGQQGPKGAQMAQPVSNWQAIFKGANIGQHEPKVVKRGQMRPKGTKRDQKGQARDKMGKQEPKENNRGHRGQQSCGPKDTWSHGPKVT